MKPDAFIDLAIAYVADQGAGWTSAKRKRWSDAFNIYVAPVIGRLPIAQVDADAVMRVLEPRWQDNPEAATRLRSKLEIILDYATARGWRSGSNPARWRGHLDRLLPACSKVARAEHHNALPWRQIGTFMRVLRKQPVTSALALRFAILAAARTSDVLSMRVREIDLATAIWTVPADRTVSGRPHRVPLSYAAIRILYEAARLRTSEAEDSFVFPGGKEGKPLSNMAIQMLLRRMGRDKITTLGFRRTFRDWCAEGTGYSQAVADAALAYQRPAQGKTVHQCDDLIDERRRLMVEWARFCDQLTLVAAHPD